MFRSKTKEDRHDKTGDGGMSYLSGRGTVPRPTRMRARNFFVVFIFSFPLLFLSAYHKYELTCNIYGKSARILRKIAEQLFIDIADYPPFFTV